MSGSAHDWFIDVDVTISDFQVETTFGISADPCLVVNIGSLAAEIR